MKRKCIIGMSLVVVLAAGCAGRDAKFARKVLDAAYAGSLTPVKDSMTPVMQQAMTDAQMAAVGTALNQQAGAVKSLKLRSRESITQAGQEYSQEIWAVTAEKNSFDMRMVKDKDGKLAGLWFQPPSAQ